MCKNNYHNVDTTNKYTTEIDRLRDRFPIFFNFKKEKILCIERINQGLKNEKTMITLDIYDNTENTPHTLWTMEISRWQHNMLLKVITDPNYGKNQ